MASAASTSASGRWKFIHGELMSQSVPYRRCASTIAGCRCPAWNFQWTALWRHTRWLPRSQTINAKTAVRHQLSPIAITMPWSSFWQNYQHRWAWSASSEHSSSAEQNPKPWECIQLSCLTNALSKDSSTRLRLIKTGWTALPEGLSHRRDYQNQTIYQGMQHKIMPQINCKRI